MRRFAVLCALAVSLCQTPALADDPREAAWCGEEPCLPPKYDASRTVNGHVFLPMLTVPFPFVTTRVGSQTGMGVINLESIPLASGTTITTGDDAKLVAFVQSFAIDVKLVRFLGLTGGFAVGNAVGINSSGAYNLGINYSFGANLGAVARLAHGDKWYLSLNAVGQLQRAEAVLPSALAQSATDDNGTITFTISSLTQGGSIATGSGNLMLAYSPHRAIGLTASAGYQSQRVEVASSSGRSGDLLFGLGSSWRFNSVGAPLALTLGGSLSIRTDETERVFFPTVGAQGKTNGYVEGGILYSDPKYVDAGIQAAWSVARNDNRKTIQLILNHFW